MGKSIVICSDGTGQRGGSATPTNVWRTYVAVDTSDSSQLCLHSDGVGSGGNRILKTIGGAFGYGISANIRDLYRSLIYVYEPGDKLYLFGFSRGAYTVRVLAHAICMFGIPDKEVLSPQDVDFAARDMVDRYKTANTELAESKTNIQTETTEEIEEKVQETSVPPTAERYRKQFSNKMDTRRYAANIEAMTDADQDDAKFPIHFLGCWDTVEALGLPFAELTMAISGIFPLQFRSLVPNKGIHHIYHALSVDDERRTFHPKVFDEREKANGQTIKQVWFPGAHSHIGGGYAKDQLALNCLLWMVKQAERHDLKFDKSKIQEYQAEASEFGQMHDSRAGMLSFYRYAPRQIEKLLLPEKGQSVPTHPNLHESAMKRIDKRHDGYAPTAISTEFNVEGSTPDDQYELASLRHKVPNVKAIEKARDFIWIRQLVYWIMMALIFGVIICGWQNQNSLDQTPLIPVDALPGFLKWVLVGVYSIERYVLDLLIAILPAMIGKLLHGLSMIPGAFSVFLFLFIFVRLIQGRLKQIISHHASLAWHVPSASENVEPAATTAKQKNNSNGNAGISWLRRIRRSIFGKWVFVTNKTLGAVAIVTSILRRRFGRYANSLYYQVAPLIGWLGLAAMLIAAIIMFGRMGWMEYHRSETTSPGNLSSLRELNEQTAMIQFDTKSPYHPVGLHVQKGVRYSLLITRADKSPDWKDQEIPASPTGISVNADVPIPVRITQKVLRRNLNAEIFAVQIGIGDDGDHIYDVSGKTEFTAPISGPLFVFVNDVPGFYNNNTGVAEVCIRRIDKVTNQKKSATIE